VKPLSYRGADVCVFIVIRNYTFATDTTKEASTLRFEICSLFTYYFYKVVLLWRLLICFHLVSNTTGHKNVTNISFLLQQTYMHIS